MIETLLGGVFGGLLRLAPEVLKLFDRANERKHELALLGAEMEFAKVKGEIAMRQTEAAMAVEELNTIGEAFKEQSKTAIAAGWFIAAVSALVRPLVTYAFLVMYVAVKVAAYMIALDQGGNWKEVLLTMWTSEDLAIFNLVISFWFVGRIYERGKR